MLRSIQIDAECFGETVPPGSGDGDSAGVPLSLDPLTVYAPRRERGTQA
ncbi:MAG: hypothetical protein QOG25_1764, partial [Acetobacteraceae bacterium]|nr:hypothetical protein [Acetobacteraceae bacterium]